MSRISRPTRACAFRRALAVKSRKEEDILFDRQIGIEIFAKALRHVGDARADFVAPGGERDVAAQHFDAAVLQRFRPGDQSEQRRFADTVGPDQTDHAAGRNVERQSVQRPRPPVGMAEIAQADGGRNHFSAPCNAGVQSALSSVLT